MNKDLLSMIIEKPTEGEIRALCRQKKENLGFDMEKALFPVNPLEIESKINVDEALVLLKGWASVGGSVRASVRASVWASVWDSVRASVRASVWASVLASVRASVLDSVWASVRASVRASVLDSVWASVRASVLDSVWASAGDSVRAYISSIFYKIDFGIDGLQSGVDLWEAGYMPSFDGTNWRLHTKNGIVFTGTVDNL